jgi:hypothetical protein
MRIQKTLTSDSEEGDGGGGGRCHSDTHSISSRRIKLRKNL